MPLPTSPADLKRLAIRVALAFVAMRVLTGGLLGSTLSATLAGVLASVAMWVIFDFLTVFSGLAARVLLPDLADPMAAYPSLATLVLSGDAPMDQGRPQLLRGIEQLSQALPDPESRALLDDASAAVLRGDVYRALKRLRALLPREDRLLGVA